MRNFILGMAVTLLVLLIGSWSFMTLGLFPTHAAATPPRLETRIAHTALNASIDRRAPRASSPVPATDDNLIAGMKIYTMHCAVCHGGLDNKPSPLQNRLYPPAPQLVLEPLDDPEWHIFYAVRTGIRYTGMPAWEKVLSEEDIWKVTSFLSHLQKLPPGVQEYWKNSFGTTPQAEGTHEHHHH
jgi:mono/diheme cytochrome c family protein